MRIEIVAVGTELLLGQIADTNSAWLGDRLASAGVTSHFHQAVGDNHERIVLAFRTALARSDGIIVCGGLGPTQDDITREAIADVMGVDLVRHQEIVDVIAGFFQARGRTMSANNARQADVPVGRHHHPAAGRDRARPDLPAGQQGDLRRTRRALRDGRDVRAGHPARPAGPHGRGRGGGRHREPGAADLGRQRVRRWPSRSRAASTPWTPMATEPAAGAVTLAFLASGIEGIKVRITARAADAGRGHRAARSRGEGVRAGHRGRPGRHRVRRGRRVHGGRRGHQLIARGVTLGVAESLTGGLIASRLVNVPGASAWFRGGVVAYHEQVKFDVLGVPVGPVVTEAAAAAMAEGVLPGDRLRRRPGHHRRGRPRRPGGRCPRAPSSSA